VQQKRGFLRSGTGCKDRVFFLENCLGFSTLCETLNSFSPQKNPKKPEKKSNLSPRQKAADEKKKDEDAKNAGFAANETKKEGEDKN
jgi:hypothetical protein